MADGKWSASSWFTTAWYEGAWGISSGSPGDSLYDGVRKVIYVLPSVAGLVKWVDYIPVRVVVPSDGTAGSYDEGGSWPVDAIASPTGLTAWVDYTPVFEVADSANKWRYENDGWIPVDTITP